MLNFCFFRDTNGFSQGRFLLDCALLALLYVVPRKWALWSALVITVIPASTLLLVAYCRFDLKRYLIRERKGLEDLEVPELGKEV
jgi:hypothetical protein